MGRYSELLEAQKKAKQAKESPLPSSAVDNVPAMQRPEQPVSPAPVLPLNQADPAPSAPPSGRTGVRRLTRVPFELFQDQLDRLRKISLDAKVRGEKGSMSEMVRQAIDRYLAENYPEEEK